MPTELPSGRWRTRVRHPRTGKQLSARAVIGGPDTYPTRKEAEAAEAEARRLLRSNARIGVTVGEWWTTWTTDPLWARPSESTNIHYRERTERFVRQHWDEPLRAIGDEHVAAWLKGGRNLGTVQQLRVMLNDASSAAGGRLVDRNPFANLRLPASRGRKDMQPPSEAQIASLIALADELTPPSFAAYLAVGCHEGMRPGELDALRWTKIDFQAETILVDEQWNSTTRKFTKPKEQHNRTVALTDPARERLLRLPRESEFAFTTLRGSHYRPSSRAHHWNRVRAAAGLGNTPLYLATKHYFGWYGLNVLELPAHLIAEQFGHQDGGELVLKLYGHPDARIAREKIREAYRPGVRPAVPTPLRAAGNRR